MQKSSILLIPVLVAACMVAGCSDNKPVEPKLQSSGDKSLQRIGGKSEADGNPAPKGSAPGSKENSSSN